MTTWAKEEFKTVDFGDKRLDERLVKVATRLSENSVESIPSACRGWHETKTTYRFFDSGKVKAEKILSSHIEATKTRISSQDRVLLIQDTSELDYSEHYQKEGIGYLNSVLHKGLLIHPLLAVTEDRVPLGLAGMTWWARETIGQAKRHEERAIEDKETMRWLEHYRAGNKLAEEYPKTQFVVVGDRESDIYEILMEATETKKSPKSTAELLVRSSHDRRVKTRRGKEGKLRDVASRATVLGEIEFMLRPRKGEKKRLVKQHIRATKLTILPTQRRGEREVMQPFEITVIHAKEIRPPQGSKAVEWFLLTTVEVGKNFQLACQVIQWYLARWDIELYFKALKSGCSVEQIQLEEAQRFTACLALYMVIAWRILFLMKIARTQPNLKCTEFLSEEEWQAAYIIIKKKKPTQTPTIGEAINMIAQVGGYLARKSDGPPGMKNLWRGFTRIQEVRKYNEIINNF